MNKKDKHIEADRLLSAEVLTEYSFSHISARKNPFSGHTMPYFAKESVILLYNEGEDNKNSFLIGYAATAFDAPDYFLVTFRWINRESQLIEVYEAVKGQKLLKGDKKTYNWE